VNLDEQMRSIDRIENGGHSSRRRRQCQTAACNLFLEEQ
jgi:hypothetical protein